MASSFGTFFIFNENPTFSSDGPMRPYGVGLEDHPDVALVGGDADLSFGVVDDGVADGDPAAAGLFQAGDAPHGAGLAATGLAEQNK